MKVNWAQILLEPRGFSEAGHACMIAYSIDSLHTSQLLPCACMVIYHVTYEEWMPELSLRDVTFKQSVYSSQKNDLASK